MKLILSIILLVTFFSFHSVFAGQYKIEKTESTNGFPSNVVYKIYQDSKGYIWFGTMYGLYRYDGVNYIPFRYNPYDSTSIGNDDIISIFEDSKGFLWFGTYLGGVSRYDSKTSSFTRFLYKQNSNSICDNTVWAITEDKSGALWFGTQNGLSKFANNTFTNYRDINGNTKSNHVLSLACDIENNLWIGTFTGGLFKYNSSRTIFDTYHRSAFADSLNGNVIRCLYCDSNGNLWAGMIKRGVCMIKADDLKKGKYVFNKSLFDSTISKAPGNSSIYEISEDRKGNLFFSSSNMLYKYDCDDNTFAEIFISNSGSENSECISMLCDFSNCIWISSYENCLYKIKQTPGNFINLTETSDGKEIGSVKSIFYDSVKQNYLFGSNAGLFEYNESTGKIGKIKIKNLISEVNSLAKDNSGNLLLGTGNGLIVISQSGEEKSIFTGLNFTNLLKYNGQIAAGTNNGLFFINTVSWDTISYRNIPNNNTSLSDNSILSLYNDNLNNIWAGTYGGLNKFNRDKNNFDRFAKNLNDTNSLSNNYIYSIVQKDENNLYLGTAGGLNIFNFKTNKILIFRDINLSNSVVNSMLPVQNKIWMGTNRGLIRLDLGNSSVKMFEDNSEGVIFNPGAIIKTYSGNIAAGSKSGLIIFNSEKLIGDTGKPLISFTDLRIFGENKSKTLDITRLREIELNSFQNNLQVDFALMDFTRPNKNFYEYKLEGIDKNWISTGNKNFVFYSNLNPGNYELKIRGTNYEGIKSDEKTLLIIIRPPFWKTIWFYCLAGTITLFIVFAIYKYRLNKNIRLALEIEHAKEEERDKWREQASIDYHDELGHKLTRISLYSRRVLKKMNGSANEIITDVNNIIETSNSLRMSARDLIWSLNPSEDSLQDFITRINLFADELFENSHIKFHRSDNFPEWKEIELIMEVKRQIMFILKEAMNNSLKYSKAKNLWLNISANNQNLSVELKDDGKGFNIDAEYTGYGLLNMQKRARKAGLKIDIISSIGNGTVINISGVLFSFQPKNNS